MTPPSSNASPKMSNRLSAVLDLLLPVLLDVSTALGSLKEGQRLSEQRLDRHGRRLAHVEGRITSLEQTTSTSKPCSPTHPSRAPATRTPTTPNSTTAPPSSASTATGTDTTLSRTLKRFGRAAMKDLLSLAVQKIGTVVFQLLTPAALALLPWWGRTFLDWMRSLWHFLAG